MSIANEMTNHCDTIFDQHVVEKILISVTEKYEYIVGMIEEMKDLSKLSIKDLVGSFRAHGKRRSFREDQPKEPVFQFRTNENSQIFSKNQQKKNYNPKKKLGHEDSSRKIEKTVRKVLVFFVNFKRNNHKAEKFWHKGKP